MIKNVRENLTTELKKIYDDEDFIRGTIAIARSENTMKTLLDFIKEAYRRDDAVTSDEIIKLTMYLRDKEDVSREKRKIVAAML